MAGMASLVSYPVLLSLGLPPVSADVTNTTAQIFTGIGSTLSSAKELHSARHATIFDAAWALVGSVCGCILLLVAPASSFEKTVPILIAFAGALMLYSLFNQTPVKKRGWQPLIKGIALFLVGIYIGYFGASAGVITLAILTLAEDLPFATTNAIKNFISFTGNGLAMLIYASTADVRWVIALAAFGLAIYLAITTD